VPEPTFDELVAAMKKGAGILQDAGIPFVLAGGLAAWSRGGPKTEHDVDFMIKAEDAAGHRTERPPERWLYKAYVDSDVLIDLIFNPSGGAVTDESLERAEELEVAALRLRVASLEDVLVTKLLSLTEQEPAFEGVLELARALREQIDWDDVRERTADSPFAKAFFTLVEELGIVERTEA
jgi:predicted nucleotidyltransferase